jgi:hypothetical protein
MRTIPIHPAASQGVVLSVEPKMVFGTQEQKTRQGVPVWSVRVHLDTVDEAARVSVAAPQQPSVTVGQRVTLVGLSAGAYAVGDRSGLYFEAREVQA